MWPGNPSPPSLPPFFLPFTTVEGIIYAVLASGIVATATAGATAAFVGGVVPAAATSVGKSGHTSHTPSFASND